MPRRWYCESGRVGHRPFHRRETLQGHDPERVSLLLFLHISHSTEISYRAVERIIETGRLIMRHWSPGDADALYKYASDERVSEMALWPCHSSVEMSRDVINVSSG